MTIAFANSGGNLTNNNDLTSYATPSWAPPTSGIILCAVSSGNTGPASEPTSISGNSLTWERIGSVIQGGIRRVTLYAALAAPATTGITTIDFGSETQAFCDVIFTQVTVGVLASTAAAHIAQIVSNSGASGTSATATLAGAGNANNRPFACVFSNSTTQPVPVGTNWVGGNSAGGTAPGRRHRCQWNATNYDTAVNATVISTSWSVLAVEIIDNPTVQYVDSGTVNLRFNVFAEVSWVDTLLSGVLSRRWDGVANQRYSGVAIHRFSASLAENRWNGTLNLRSWSATMTRHLSSLHMRHWAGELSRRISGVIHR